MKMKIKGHKPYFVVGLSVGEIPITAIEEFF